MANKKTKSEWEQIITACKSSGITAKNWCETNHISFSSYKYWLTRLNKQKKAEANISWAEVKNPVEGTSICPKTAFITLRYDDFAIDISDAVETQLLAEVLKTLRSIC